METTNFSLNFCRNVKIWKSNCTKKPHVIKKTFTLSVISNLNRKNVMNGLLTLIICILKWDLKRENNWKANFYLFVIQMVHYSDAQYHGNRFLNSEPIFKWWSECHRSIGQCLVLSSIWKWIRVRVFGLDCWSHLILYYQFNESEDKS